MKGNRFLRDILGVVVVAVLVLAACGGGPRMNQPDTGGAPVSGCGKMMKSAPEEESEAAEPELETEAEDTPDPKH